MNIRLKDVVDQIIARAGPRIVCGVPLGLGKPNALLNALYDAVAERPDVTLEIFTALSLDVPEGRSDLERRFLGPFVQRHFGADYPRLRYVADLRRNQVPANITISEFYLQSGAWLGNAVAQRNYISTNYTFVARDMVDRGVNLLLQMVAKRSANDGQPRYSLSCNPDVTLDLVAELERRGQDCLRVAQVNRELPFMLGDADVSTDFFDLIVDDEALDHRLFGVPRQPVAAAEYAIGLNASALIADAGTLQIGIGALGDALTRALLLRQHHNADYRAALTALAPDAGSPGCVDAIGGRAPFATGLYAASEMFTEGFMHLYRGGVLKRRVYDDVPLQRLLNEGAVTEEVTLDGLRALVAYRELPRELEPQHVRWLEHFGFFRPGVEVVRRRLRLPDAREVQNDLENPATLDAIGESALGDRLRHGAVLHAAFLLGSSPFYQALRDLQEEERDRFRMTAVSNINQLYGGRETLDRLQRANARFVNTAMMMTLTGAAVSDQLADGRVVSGVGGQYNFVAMAHAMHDGRSILMVRSTRTDGRGNVDTNIRFNYGHVTVPRHLRDIVITEYGIADLRGRSDEECIERMLAISDARFQEDLASQAIKAGKLRSDYVIPDACRNNLPERLGERLQQLAATGLMERFPFGSDLDEVELRAAGRLRGLQRDAATWRGRVRLLQRLLRGGAGDAAVLQRLNLESPKNLRERLLRRLLS